MIERKMAEDNKILEVVTGSFMYGTNIETSDKDYFGIYMPDKEFVYGFKKCEEVDLSIKDKLESGKNSEKAVDRMFFEFRKFVKLAMENNPNVLEQLFSTEKNIIYKNKIGERLLSIRDKFPYKGLVQKFKGFAKGQKHKMQIRSDKFNELKKGLDILNEISKDDPSLYVSEIFQLQENKILQIDEYFKKGFDATQNVSFVCVGDLNLQPSWTVSKSVRKIEERLSKVGNRKELITDKGFDYKFGCHLLRLLFECKELLQTGVIEFPLKERDLLIDVRRGNWKIQEVLDLSDQLEAEIDELEKKTSLPEKPNYEFIESFVIEEMERWFCNKSYEEGQMLILKDFMKRHEQETKNYFDYWKQFDK